jgi:hypothetical protein
MPFRTASRGLVIASAVTMDVELDTVQEAATKLALRRLQLFRETHMGRKFRAIPSAATKGLAAAVATAPATQAARLVSSRAIATPIAAATVAAPIETRTTDARSRPVDGSRRSR